MVCNNMKQNKKTDVFHHKLMSRSRINVIRCSFYLQHPTNVFHIIYMMIHVQITSLWLQKVEKRSVSTSLDISMKLLKITFKFERTYLAVSSNFCILVGFSSLMACLLMNHGEISALTSSGIFDRRLVCWFIITHVLSTQKLSYNLQHYVGFTSRFLRWSLN